MLLYCQELRFSFQTRSMGRRPKGMLTKLAPFLKFWLVLALVTCWPELGHVATPVRFIRRWQGEGALEVEGGLDNRQFFAKEHLLKMIWHQNLGGYALVVFSFSVKWQFVDLLTGSNEIHVCNWLLFYCLNGNV